MKPQTASKRDAKIFVENIRSVVSDRVEVEDERVPSYTALWRHWLRSCYVLGMWHNSFKTNIYEGLPQPQDSGWLLQNDTYTIDWDCSEVQERV